MGLVGHLEDTLAQKISPSVTARFGHRLPGFSGVTLPGSGQNIRGLPRSLRRGGSDGDNGGGKKIGIGKPRAKNGWSYF